MKKIIVLCLTVSVLLCCLAACNSNSKASKDVINVSISTLEAKLKGSDDEFEFTIKETSSGYSFEYIKSTATSNVTYSGAADKDQSVTSVEIVYNKVDNDIVTNKSVMRTALDHLSNNNWRQLTIGEVRAANCFVDLLAIHMLLGEEDVSTETLLDIVCENKTIKINGWSVSAKSIASTVTISMNK